MTTNAKNQLLELFQDRGWELPTFHHSLSGPPWESSLDMVLPDNRVLKGKGSGRKKPIADVAAAEQALANLESDPDPDSDLWLDAQRGDALIKLAAYLGVDLVTPEDKSQWLQDHEADDHLASTLKRWSDAGDEEAQAYWGGRGHKHRATVVEALIWRRFHKRILGPDALPALREILQLLTTPDDGLTSE
ncbi:MAG: hypothetical protein ACJATT_002958 [Myxococcota bacterium]